VVTPSCDGNVAHDCHANPPSATPTPATEAAAIPWTIVNGCSTFRAASLRARIEARQ